MEIGILMGLLSLGLLFGMGGDNDSDEEPVEQPDVEKDVEGELVLFDSSETLFGTENNDTLEGGQDQSLAPNVVNLGAGDDNAFINTNSSDGSGIGVYGEEGDDKIEFSSAVGTAQATGVGGEGDDTLTATDGTRLFGEAGSDVLNFEILGTYDGAGRVNGGDGDDILNASSFYGATDALTPSTIQTEYGDPAALSSAGKFIGGDGSDTFNIDLDPIAFDSEVEVGEEYSKSVGLSIIDFDPSEDSLVVNVNRPEGDEGGPLEATIAPVIGSDDIYVLSLSFGATDLTPAYTNTLRIGSTTPLTLDDVIITENNGVAA